MVVKCLHPIIMLFGLTGFTAIDGSFDASPTMLKPAASTFTWMLTYGPRDTLPAGERPRRSSAADEGAGGSSGLSSCLGLAGLAGVAASAAARPATRNPHAMQGRRRFNAIIIPW